jgi:hypothetical protein
MQHSIKVTILDTKLCTNKNPHLTTAIIFQELLTETKKCGSN